MLPRSYIFEKTVAHRVKFREKKIVDKGGDGELLFNGYSVSVWDGEQGLEMDDCVTI